MMLLFNKPSALCTVMWCALALPLAAHAQSAGSESAQGDVVESIGDTTEGGGDMMESVTEVIDGSPATSASSDSSPPPTAAAPAGDRTSVTGWYREHLQWTFWEGGLHEAYPDPLALRRDRLLSRTQLLMRTSYHHEHWFEAAASGVFTLDLHEEGPAGAEPFNGFNGQAARMLARPELLELFVGLTLGALDVRIGQQRVSWGKADVLSPNEVVNRRDFGDPFFGDAELRYRPTPLLRADMYLGPIQIQGLFAPVFVADRAVLFGENWAALQPDSPAQFRGLTRLMERVLDSSLRPQLNELLQQTRYPDAPLAGFQAGGKLGITGDGWDADVYYYYGYDGLPFVRVDPAFAYLLGQVDFNTATVTDLEPVLRGLERGLRPLTSEYIRRHHVGFDASTTAGPFILRIDTAFENQRVFYRTDLTSAVYPTFLGVASIEFQTGELDQLIILEAIYIALLEPVTAPLLSYAQQSFGFALLARWPIVGDLSLELRGTLGLVLRSYTLQPALCLKLGSVVISAGGIWLDGEERSLGWYNRNNSGAMLQLRGAF